MVKGNDVHEGETTHITGGYQWPLATAYRPEKDTELTEEHCSKPDEPERSRITGKRHFLNKNYKELEDNKRTELLLGFGI